LGSQRFSDGAFSLMGQQDEEWVQYLRAGNAGRSKIALEGLSRDARNVLGICFGKEDDLRGLTSVEGLQLRLLSAYVPPDDLGWGPPIRVDAKDLLPLQHEMFWGEEVDASDSEQEDFPVANMIDRFLAKGSNSLTPHQFSAEEWNQECASQKLQEKLKAITIAQWQDILLRSIGSGCADFFLSIILKRISMNLQPSDEILTEALCQSSFISLDPPGFAKAIKNLGLAKALGEDRGPALERSLANIYYNLRATSA